MNIDEMLQEGKIYPKDVAKLLGISVQQLCKETGYSRMALNSILNREYKDIRAWRWNAFVTKVSDMASAKSKADLDRLNNEAMARDDLIVYLFKLGVS